MGPKILIFSWNHQALRICETDDPVLQREHRERWFTSYRYECEMPDFFTELQTKITEEQPELVVFGSQEDASPGSYFHSHFLPDAMGNIGYDLLKRIRLMGIGMETWKSAQRGDLKFRGLRMSVYSRSDLTGEISMEEVFLRDLLGNDGQSWAICSSSWTQSKGALASYVQFPGMDTAVFICAHLPFHSRSLLEATLGKSEEEARAIRQASLEESNECFQYLLDQLVFRLPPEISLGHLFFFGDLNYRVFAWNAAESIDPVFLQEHEELRREIREGRIALPFQEGVENRGPLFLPTCKLRKPRPETTEEISLEEIYNVGKYFQRTPSWCDRILYYDFSSARNYTLCLEYNRFDVGETMGKSDHAAIYGVYQWIPKNLEEGFLEEEELIDFILL